MLRHGGTYVTLYITPLVALFLMDFSASFDFLSLQTDTLSEQLAAAALVFTAEYKCGTQ